MRLRKHTSGFALLDALLAVILLAVASYGSYMVAKSFHTAASVQNLEQRAITIAQNYTPFLQDTTTTSVYDSSSNELSVEFLESIGIPTDAIVNSSSTYSEVYSGSSYGSGKDGIFNFEAITNDATTAGNYLIIGVNVTGAQLNQVIQDLSTTFSIFYVKGKNSSISSASSVADSGLVGTSNSGSKYSMFLVFPKMSTVSSSASLTTVSS